MEVLQFVELGAINPLSFDHPYYLSPRKGGEKAYGVLRDALLDARRIGIVRFVLRKRPTLAALLPGTEALALETLRSYEEVRDPKKLGVPAHAKKSAEVKMARMLVDQMSGEGWDPSEHPNAYRKALAQAPRLEEAVRDRSRRREERARGGKRRRSDGRLEEEPGAVAESAPRRAPARRRAGAA